MRELNIALGRSCSTRVWTNKTISFQVFIDRLRKPCRTQETVAEYQKMNNEERSKIKDHGGFVAGELKDGCRRVNSVISRSMITLDADRLTPEFLRDIEGNLDYEAVLYTTHSSTSESPRARIVLPLTRDVSPEECVAISRYMADELGMGMFDECSFRINQMMYWPSVPADGEYICLEVRKKWLDPDEYLSRHPEWHDPLALPVSPGESKERAVGGNKVKDPLAKEGAVGAFNRVYYPIQRAVEKYLPKVYELSADGKRYRYTPSESGSGVEILENGKFLYSHHATDPACMKLCNAFDIVRIHIFGELGEKKSYNKMVELAAEDEEVRLQRQKDKLKEAQEDFCDEITDSDEWKKKLTYTGKNLKLENTYQNLKLILENDPLLKGIVFNRLTEDLEIIGEIAWEHPTKYWRDVDEAHLVDYVDTHYGTFSKRNYDMAVNHVADHRSYHPIREMFEALPAWDGTRRVDTLLIDYLGAEDTPYVRAVTRKILCAAYLRVYHPGRKFDYIVVLNGKQGIGKSTLVAMLGGQWFSDSLSLSDMNDKTAAEKLQGYWIHEIGELAGIRKADMDRVKAFISRQDDKFRVSFGRRVTPHPRQCVFFGTTNSENGYLRDATGNRRFWNVKVAGNGKYKPWDLNQDTVDQIWAEVMKIAEGGEKLFLEAELEVLAQEEQKKAMEEDEREGIVRTYLETLLPEKWDNMDIHDRRNYLEDVTDPIRPHGVKRREIVCNYEIWCECFGRPKDTLTKQDVYLLSVIMMHIEGWTRVEKKIKIPPYGWQRYYLRTD